MAFVIFLSVVTLFLAFSWVLLSIFLLIKYEHLIPKKAIARCALECMMLLVIPCFGSYIAVEKINDIKIERTRETIISCELNIDTDVLKCNSIEYKRK